MDLNRRRGARLLLSLEDCFEACSRRMCSPRYQEGTFAIPSIGGGIYGFEPKNSSLTLVEEAFETLLQIEAILCIAAWKVIQDISKEVWPFQSSKWCDRWINRCIYWYFTNLHKLILHITVYKCTWYYLPLYTDLPIPLWTNVTIRIYIALHCTISFHVVISLCKIHNIDVYIVFSCI